MDKRLWNTSTKTIIPYVPGEQPKTKCIKLNTNENPYPPSKRVTEILNDFSTELLRKYPDPQASVLRGTLGKLYDVSEDMVFTGNGSDEVLYFIFKAFFDKDREVAFADITYSFYPVYARSLGIPFSLIKLREDFTIDVAGYLDFRGGIVIANPNAPTGITTSPEDIEKIIAADPDRLVVIDEAYIDFGGESVIPLVKKYDNLLVVQTVSKSRALAGLRVGYAIGDPSLIKALESVRDTVNSYTLDAVAQAAAAAALKDDEWFAEIRSRIIQTREQLIRKLGDLGFITLPSAANFVFTTNPGFDARLLYEELKKKGILIRYFGSPRIEQYLRITVGTPEETESLCDALAELTAGKRKDRI